MTAIIIDDSDDDYHNGDNDQNNLNGRRLRSKKRASNLACIFTQWNTQSEFFDIKLKKHGPVQFLCVLSLWQPIPDVLCCNLHLKHYDANFILD